MINMKKIALLTLALFSTNAFAEEIDHRRVLTLNETNRHLVLTEMRALFSGTQAILGALANDDMKAVAQAAKPLGMGMAHNAENHLHDALPKEFMMMGKTVHIAFDEIALDAETVKDSKHTLKQLNQAFGQCTACHSAYQIRPLSASEARLDEVASRGIHVMPFDLDKTLHVFTKVEKGGVQQVIVKDKNDDQQIQLIRQHLSKITREFNQGNYSNPVKIHGDKMAGLEALGSAEKGTLSIIYKELPDGAQIDYSSEKANLASAIHQFFNEQLSDHARHAVTGHSQHHQQ
jgi:hypothetical protein